MRDILKIELKKALRSKTFIFAICLGAAIALLQIIWFYNNIYLPNNQMLNKLSTWSIYDQEYGTWYETGVLEGWMGCEGYSPYNQVYYIMFPLLAALPFAWSLFSEWKSGYVNQMVTRMPMHQYIMAKYIAVFISGGIAVIVPLIINFVIIACFVPCIATDPMSMQVIMSVNCFGALLYLKYPVLYVLLYLVIDFLCGGIYACIALLVTHCFDSPFPVITFPLLLHCCLLYGIETLFPDFIAYNIGAFINPAYTSNKISGMSVALTIFTLLLIMTGIYYLVNRKKDVIKQR